MQKDVTTLDDVDGLDWRIHSFTLYCLCDLLSSRQQQ